MIEDYRFSHEFKIGVLDEVRAGLKIYYYPDVNLKGGSDGVMVSIREKNSFEWIGIFAFGTLTKGGFSGVFTMPSQNEFCVVSNGNGFVVTADAPTKWEAINSIPIIDVRVLFEKGMIVFADYTKLTAYDAGGMLWKSKRLSFDGLKLTEQDESFIYGEYFDIRSDKVEKFKVDLKNGENVGNIPAIE